MMKRISIIAVSIVAGTFLVASGIYLFSSAHGLRDYASISIWCSIGVAVIGACMMSGSGGPRRSDDAHFQITAYQMNPDIEKFDRQDRERGGSLGLLVFISGVISGLLGYALYSIP